MIISPKKRLEKDLVKSIIHGLSLHIPEIIWIDRLQCGMAWRGPYPIHLCREGTPDIYALIKANGGHTVFIEAKRPGGGTQRDAQREFEAIVWGLPHIHYILSRDVGSIVEYIREKIL